LSRAPLAWLAGVLRPLITADAAITRCIVFPGAGHAIGRGSWRAGGDQGFGKEMGMSPNFKATCVVVALKSSDIAHGRTRRIGLGACSEVRPS
jgi:hypothetical protein